MRNVAQCIFTVNIPRSEAAFVNTPFSPGRTEPTNTYRFVAAYFLIFKTWHTVRSLPSTFQPDGA